MKRSDLLVVPIFLLLALLFLWPVILGGQTLIPADNLFAFPPWRAFATQFNTSVPHNELLSDLLLENYAWKKFIVESIQHGELPLWNPYLFTGVPFLAAGQHSALYPFSILFYIFPIEVVYGWFVAIQLGIGGAAMFVFARTLGLGRMGALVAALTYAFSGFFLVSVVFPMVISAACWLPLLLLCEEQIIAGKLSRKATTSLGRINGAQGSRSIVVWIVLGALALGVSFLAGHVEISYYNLIVMAFYALWRIITQIANREVQLPVSHIQFLIPHLQVILAVSLMVCLGIALAAVQIIPLYELVSRSFRQGAQSYETIVGYAYPIRQVITFFIPDFFGNPSHHGYFDLFAQQYVPITHDASGNSINTIFWGVKNYVEAGSYLGILPMLLALIAIVSAVRYRATLHTSRFTLLFTTLVMISLAFIFGTPLYAILFYGLPGINQLHSPFRWVYPFTLSVAVLAGIGTQLLADQKFPHRLWSWIPFWSGVMILLVLALSLFVPAPFISFADKILHGSDLAQRAFPDARAFFSYEAINLAKFALFLLCAGAIIRISRCPIYLLPRIPIWQPLAILVIIADLFVFGHGFYPAADPQLLKFTPPAVKFLQADKSLFRIATLDREGEKLFNANVGMFYGLQDIRGYDSIIPKQYADWMNLIEGQGELLYNRIAPFYWHGSLDSALLDLANVKYVLTTQEIPNTAKFTKVYSGEINIYRNEQVLPRVFVVREARVLTDYAAQLKSLDPSHVVLVDGTDLASSASSQCQQELPAGAAITKYSANEVVVVTSVVCDSWLVLADAYFEGWQAFDKVDTLPEREVRIYRADGNFRAVKLDRDGSHTIRFKYNPISFRVGAALSFFAAIALLLLSGYWLWGKRVRASAQAVNGRAASRVLKNSALPMAALFLNKAIDTVFTLFMLRVLGVENAGKLATATIIIGYCDIVVNFGLSTLVTRDVSRDHSLANRYLSNTGVMRLMLIVALVPLLAVYLWATGQPADTTLAIILLFISLVPSSISASLSAIFYATEQMEYPAAITVITTLLKVMVGTLVLLAGLGFVGLAGANIFVNVATMTLLLTLFIRKFFVPRPEFDTRFGRNLIGTSYPLMLNDMLSRMFNRVDILILQQLQGNIVVGWYSTTYKYLEGINILPSTFTIALFPVLSRYAAGAPDALMRAYLKSMKYLVIIAMPLMVLSFVYADFIIYVFGGPAFLPESAIALRLIIGFLPLSFINNVTHYVLIAVNQQKFLTKAFIVGALFNIVANLIFIPLFSYRASAVITIFSELALLIPFYIGIRAHVGKVDWFGLLWRPVLATVVMGLMVGLLDSWLGLSGWSFVAAVPLAIVAYALTLIVTGTFNADDREMLRLLMPARMRSKLIRG